MDWLVQPGIEPRFATRSLVFPSPSPAQGDHPLRSRGLQSTQSSANLVPIHPRHFNVQDDQVRLEHAGLLERQSTVRSVPDGVTSCFEQRAHRFRGF